MLSLLAKYKPTCENKSNHATTYGFYERSLLRSLNAQIYHACLKQFEWRHASRAKIPQLKIRSSVETHSFLSLIVACFDVNDLVCHNCQLCSNIILYVKKSCEKKISNNSRKCERFTNAITDKILLIVFLH